MDRQCESFSRIFSSATGLDKSFIFIRNTQTSSSINSEIRNQRLPGACNRSPGSKLLSIFSNSGHLEWRAGLLDTILKGTHPGTIPARFSVIFGSAVSEKKI